jgi:hypothetical protein
MASTYLLHLDTASKETMKLNGNPFQCIIPLARQHRYVRRVILKSAEIPLAYFQVHYPLNTFVLDGSTFTVPEGTYTASAFAETVNIVPGIAGTFSNLPNGTFRFVSSTPRTFTNVKPGDCAYKMGFVTGQNGTSIVGANAYNFSVDHFISIVFRNLSLSSSELARISFKIPVNSANGVIHFYSENVQFAQVVDVPGSVILDRFDIEVHDRFGNVLNNRGVDWSFTVALESNGVPSKDALAQASAQSYTRQWLEWRYGRRS